MSSSKFLAGIAITCLIVSSCELEFEDPLARRLTLGTIELAVITIPGYPNPSDIEFDGRVSDYDRVDSLYEAPGFGSFKHFVEVRDTSTGELLKVYYTLPLSANIRVDTTVYTTIIYRKIDSRSALIIKDKSNSLLCLFGTLLPPELALIEPRGGVQNIRVQPGEEPFNTRTTKCGREGDFNTIFGDNLGSTSVQPTQSSILFSGNKSYSVTNIANTYLIKNLKGCPDSVGQFAYAVIKQ